MHFLTQNDVCSCFLAFQSKNGSQSCEAPSFGCLLLSLHSRSLSYIIHLLLYVLSMFIICLNIYVSCRRLLDDVFILEKRKQISFKLGNWRANTLAQLPK